MLFNILFTMQTTCRLPKFIHIDTENDLCRLLFIYSEFNDPANRRVKNYFSRILKQRDKTNCI